MQSKLRHEAINHSEKGDVGVVTRFDQVIKAIRTKWGPLTGHLDSEFACRGVELGFEGIRSFEGGFGRIFEHFGG